MKSALLVIDPQNDFCEGGALAVVGASAIMHRINALAEKFDTVIVSQDWHTPDNISFASRHGVDPFTTKPVPYGEQVMWPDHCVAGTHGADFHPDVKPTIDKAIAIIRKGYRRDVDSYSALMDNDRVSTTGLEGLLRELSVTHLYIVGLAFDYCVRYTAEDGKRAGFSVTVITDATKAIAHDTEDAARDSFKELGIHETHSSQIP